MNYTKGTWRALPSGIGGTPYYVETSDLNIAQISGVRADKESRVNAHLIAAAPDLYEALKAMLNAWILRPEDSVNVLMYHMAKSALEKAEIK